MPALHTVIMVSRGPLYLDGRGFPGRESFPDEAYHDRFIRFEARPELREAEAIWAAAARATLAELTAQGKRVIFVLDNPELGFDPKSCVDLRPLRLRHKPLRSPCAVSRAEFDTRNAAYRALVEKVVADFPQVIVVDGAKPFCDTQWCWAMKDGEMLYKDDDHLSLYGARLVAREILPHLPRWP